MNANSIPEMIHWLKRINYTPNDLNRLNMIHITGTNGKGSTCAFVQSILRHLLPNRRIGLFTSPHLKTVNERIQVDARPLDEDLFAKYFWQVWDRLDRSVDAIGLLPATNTVSYFRFLTLMAWHVFLDMKVLLPSGFAVKRNQVETAIMEVGIGGEYDCTNVIPRPSCTGVTSLAIEHTMFLGNTLESIAWHKGGIFKPGAPALTVEQSSSALAVLRQRAQERHVPSLS